MSIKSATTAFKEGWSQEPVDYGKKAGEEYNNKRDPAQDPVNSELREALDHTATAEQRVLAEQMTFKREDPLNFSDHERREALTGTVNAFKSMDFAGNQKEQRQVAEQLADAHLHHAQSYLEKETNESNQVMHRALKDWLDQHGQNYSVLGDTVIFKVKPRDRKSLEDTMRGAGLDVRQATYEEREAYKYDQKPSEDGSYYYSFKIPSEEDTHEDDWLDIKRERLEKLKDNYVDTLLREDLTLDDQIESLNQKLVEAHTLVHKTEDRKDFAEDDQTTGFDHFRALHFSDRHKLNQEVRETVTDAAQESLDQIAQFEIKGQQGYFAGLSDRYIEKREEEILQAVAHDDRTLTNYLISQQKERAEQFAAIITEGVNYPQDIQSWDERGAADSQQKAMQFTHDTLSDLEMSNHPIANTIGFKLLQEEADATQERLDRLQKIRDEEEKARETEKIDQSIMAMSAILGRRQQQGP